MLPDGPRRVSGPPLYHLLERVAAHGAARGDGRTGPPFTGDRARQARGHEPVGEAAIGRLSEPVVDLPAILELDVSPLAVTPEGAIWVDVDAILLPDDR